MATSITLTDGVELVGLTADGVVEFLGHRASERAGVVLLLSGELKPGLVTAQLLAADPIRDGFGALPNDLKRAAVVTMSPYYDRRHAEYLAGRLMAAIALSRGMTPADPNADEKARANQVPYADIARMQAVGDAAVAALDEAVAFPVIGRAQAAA